MEIFSAHEKMTPCAGRTARRTATSAPCAKRSCECAAGGPIPGGQGGEAEGRDTVHVLHLSLRCV